jgi:hypothetical protein
MKNNCFSLVIDTSLGNSRGHYLQFSIDVFESYERTQRAAIFLTSNHTLWDWYQTKKFEFVELHFAKCDLGINVFSMVASFISARANSSSRPIHMFVLRGKDLSEEHRAALGKLLLLNSNLHIEVLVNVSGIISGTNQAFSEQKVINDFTNLGRRVSFLAWDKRAPNSLKVQNCRFLPEPKSAIPRLTRPSRKIIGFYGKLSFERGLFDLLLSVFFNPNLHYQISGYGFNRKYLYRSQNFVSMRQTPFRGLLSITLNYLVQIAFYSKRVTFEERYYTDEMEMSSEMQMCSAIFFSCARSPYTSGLVYQSLASGIPVVWTPGNSAMAYVLEESFALGRIKFRDLFRWNRLFKLVKEVEELSPTPIFDYDSFDHELHRFPFE